VAVVTAVHFKARWGDTQAGRTGHRATNGWQLGTPSPPAQCTVATIPTVQRTRTVPALQDLPDSVPANTASCPRGAMQAPPNHIPRFNPLTALHYRMSSCQHPPTPPRAIRMLYYCARRFQNRTPLPTLITFGIISKQGAILAACCGLPKNAACTIPASPHALRRHVCTTIRALYTPLLVALNTAPRPRKETPIHATDWLLAHPIPLAPAHTDIPPQYRHPARRNIRPGCHHRRLPCSGTDGQHPAPAVLPGQQPPLSATRRSGYGACWSASAEHQAW
jgi:hypothetical protein